MRFPELSSLRGTAINVGLLLVTLVLTLAAVEGVVRLFGLFGAERETMDPSRIVFEDVATEPTGEAEGAADDKRVSQFVLHPYQGWDNRRAPNLYETYQGVEESEFVIGIFGGSIAGMVVSHGQRALIRYLEEKRPELKGKIRVMIYGRGGYKQPQQMFFLSQMFALGVPLDVVINIDGFNEMAIGSSDAKRGRHPLLPSWNHMTKVAQLSAGTPTHEEIETSAAILALKRQAEHWRGFVVRYPSLQSFELAKAFLGRMALREEVKITELEAHLSELSGAASEDSWVNLKPACPRKDFSCWEPITTIWLNSSRVMASIADMLGAIYLHVLPPNQYVEGSKPLSPKELRVAYNPKLLWSRAATAGYPHFRRLGQELRGHGIEFHDWTMLFQDQTEPIYIDTCCHYNKLGNDILARELGRLIDEMISANEKSSTEVSEL